MSEIARKNTSRYRVTLLPHPVTKESNELSNGLSGRKNCLSLISQRCCVEFFLRWHDGILLHDSHFYASLIVLCQEDRAQRYFRERKREGERKTFKEPERNKNYDDFSLAN
jgi:hypothetical protein